MDIVLREHQEKCIHDILNKIESGAKRLSVAMTLGTGRIITSIFLANELVQKYNTSCILVFKNKLNCLQARDQLLKLEMEHKITCITISEYLNKDFDIYKVIIFHDLMVYDRKQITDLKSLDETVTISFFNLIQDIKENNPGISNQSKRLMEYCNRLTPVVCVYETQNLLDMRDTRYANDTEYSFIIHEISTVSNQLQIECQKTLTERNEAKKSVDRLQSYMKFLQQIQDQKKLKDQEAEIAHLKSLLQADEQDKEIAELKDKVASYQECIKEKDALIAQQNQMIAFMKDTFTVIGISPEVMESSFARIQTLRDSLQSELENQDEQIKERALKKLQDTVAEEINTLTCNIITVSDNRYYEEYMIGALTEEVWNKLDDKSKSFLITAKSNYDMMTKMPDHDSFDYSGVCLLVTKALEVETTKRFFTEYKKYLSEKYDSVSHWPRALRHRERGQNTDTVIGDHDFTLGSVVPTIGYRRNYDESGNIIGYSRGNYNEQQEFLNFATSNLFKPSLNRDAEQEIEMDCQFIERVRLDYRNPSAHRGELTIVSAKNCIEYVIDVQHMLKEMLIAMKI